MNTDTAGRTAQRVANFVHDQLIREDLEVVKIEVEQHPRDWRATVRLRDPLRGEYTEERLRVFDGGRKWEVASRADGGEWILDRAQVA